MDMGKMGEVAMELATNDAILDKSSDLLGMLFPYMGLTKRALEIYISDVEKSDMSSESKMIAVLNAKQTIKRLKNQKKIAEIAVNSARENTDFTKKSGVDEEWLERFMDSAGFVSTEEVQIIWGKILGKEFEAPGSTPLNMIRVLSEITPNYARAFRTICSMQGMIIEMDEKDNIISVRQDVIVPYTDNKEELQKIGLSFNILNEMDTLGLIKFDPLSGYAFSEVTSNSVLLYVSNKTELIKKVTNKLVPSGNVILTEAGRCLKSITPLLEEIDGHGDMVKKYMLRKGIRFAEETDYQVLVKGNMVEIVK